MKFWKRFRFTKISVIQAGVGAALTITALIVAYRAVGTWFYNSRYSDALYYYHSNQIEKAQPALESALSWKPGAPGPTEVLAKIKTDLGDLKEAEELYAGLIQRGVDRETVYLGMAVVHLRKADAEKKLEKSVKHLHEAGEFLKKARRKNKNYPEAIIAEATAALIPAVKSHGKAPDKFEKISQEALAHATWDGLYDYYAGQAKAASMRSSGGDEVGRAVHRAFLFAGGSEDAFINRLNLESRSLASGSCTLKELVARKPEWTHLYSTASALLLNHPQLYKRMEEPLLNFVFAWAWALGKQGEPQEAANLLERTRSVVFRKKYPLAHLAEGYGFQAASENPSAAMDRRLDFKKRASTAYERFLTEYPFTDSKEDLRLRAVVNNNLAVCYEYDAIRFNQPRMRQEAADRLRTLQTAFPDDYVIQRNLAVLLKKLNKTEEGEAVRAQVRTLSQKPGFAFERDYAEFEKYFEPR